LYRYPERKPLDNLSYAANKQFAEVGKIVYRFNGGKDEKYP